jgi:integrase/recombinase XerC
MPEHLYRMLLEGLSPTKPVDLRDRIAIRLMGDCGLRVAEVVGLEVDSLDLTSRRIWVMGKGRKPREVPIPKGLAEELKLWLKVRRVKVLPGCKTLLVNMGGRKARGKAMTADHLRTLVNGRFKELGERLENPSEMKYSGCHVLRKVAGTAVYRNTRDLGQTGKLLGHANLNTTAIYAQADLGDIGSVMDEIEEARKG